MSNFRRDLVMILIGAVIAAVFGIVIAYPALLAESKENAARIESNRKQIELLWDAHQVSHDAKAVEQGAEQ